MPECPSSLQWHAMLDLLLESYKTEDFQRRLHAGWYSTTDNVERVALRQKLCMEVQSVVMPQFGFEGNRKGVAQSVFMWRNDPKIFADLVLQEKMSLVSWLVDPDIQAMEPRGPSGTIHSFTKQFMVAADRSANEGPPPAPVCEYTVSITDSEDEAALTGVASCQGTMAGAHQALYQNAYPFLEHRDWFVVLGCNESIRDMLEFGTVILHAEVVETGQVVGYVAVSRQFGGEEGDFTQIRHIVVLPEHRKRGLGARLFRELLDFLRATSPSCAADLRLVVVELNHEARAWYKRLGFSEVEDGAVVAHPGNCAVKFMAMRRCDGAPPNQDPSEA